MKFKNRHHYDPIRELNREVERDLITPLLAIPAILLAIILVITFIIRHAEAIDNFCKKHPLLVGWSCVILSLVGIIRWAIKNYR